ncbi:antigen 332, putative [hydrothermal vent metagenome]|uniref:Antigen 332, putative n=1 Tax=hydrothermal vent metagenome TaxID=652676 RepID=A0A1W1EC40_9ZZZZ
MYYIVNQTKHIIAADKTLLDILDVANLNELHKNIALESIDFTILTDTTLEITTNQSSTSYEIVKSTMTSLLGDLTLIEVVESNQIQKEESLVKADSINIDDGINELIDELQDETKEDEPFELLSNDDSLTIDETKVENIEDTESISIPDDELLDLMSDDKTEVDLKNKEEDTPFLSEEIDIVSDNELEETDPIVIDVAKVSQKIGITSDDYNAFLNEYIDTALTLEDDLKSEDKNKTSHAITTLSHLSNVLHLPLLNNIIEQINHSDNGIQNADIEHFYKTLGRLTTDTNTIDILEVMPEETSEERLTIEPSISELVIEKDDDSSNDDSFGTIDLSDVKPIHFDFQLEEAASDLGLPVELIEEFVIDFIAQAHTETDNMLEAYKKGDLKAIQKIGHLLKGTSSNLRINPLAETLYKIQFCEDSSKLEDLIKEYWAHFLSFETKINLISK